MNDALPGPRAITRVRSALTGGWSRAFREWWQPKANLRHNSSSYPPSINATYQRLAPQAGLTTKSSYIYPSEEASVLLSVVVPCYKYGRFLPDAILSATRQTLRSMEVILVDDGSDDAETIAVLDTLDDDRCVQVVRHGVNRGLPSARNSGIALARGEFVCCLDADDTLEPTYLEKAVALLKSDLSLGFVYSWVQCFGDSTALWETRDFEIEAALAENHTSVSAVFRRDDWEACGHFDPTMNEGYEDWEFWLRLAQLGRRGRTIREPLLNHRRHGRTMTHMADEKRERLIAAIRARNVRAFEDANWRGRIQALKPMFVAESPFDVLAGMPREADARPHLLVLVPWLPIGGAEMLLADILGALKASWRLSIVTSEPGDQALTPVFAALTSEIYHLPNFIDQRHWFGFVLALLTSRGSSAILSSGSSFLYSNIAAIKARFPNILSFDILHNDAVEGHLAAALDARRHIHRLIGVSTQIGRALIDGGANGGAVAVIPNGIHYEDVFNPQRINREAARSRFGLADDDVVIGFAGRMSEEKRPLAFLAATIPILAAHPRGRLFVVGEGPMTAAFHQASRAAGISERLHHLPNLERSAMPHFYAACSMIVLSSRIEGTPLVVLEALAMGCPVVATNVGEVSTLIRNGVNGFVVPVATPMALTPHIESLVADKGTLEQMRADARRSIVDARYSAKEMLESYTALLRNAATNRDSALL